MSGTLAATRRSAAGGRRSRENTRARLVEAAADVFAEKSLRRVTVDDLVGAAGFSRGAFYSNFSSTDEVFFEVFARQAELMLAAVAEVIDGIPEGDISVGSLGRVFEALHPFGRRWFLLQNEYALLAVRDAATRERFTAQAQQLQGRMEELIGRFLLLLDREPAVPLEQLTDVLLAMYLHSLGNEQLGTGHLHPGRLVEDVLPRVILSLSRPAGS